MEINQEKNNKSYVPEAILLLILTAGSYWLSYRYESAYFSAFQLPIQLIEVSSGLILSSFIILSGALLFLFSFWNLILMMLPEHPILRAKLIRIALAITFLIWNLLSYGFRIKDVWMYIITILLIVLFEFVWPYLVFHNKKTFKERVVADEDAEEKVRSKSAFGIILNKFGPLYYFIFLFIWFTTSLVSIYGTGTANSQQIYPVDIKDPTIVVIRMYNSKIICIRYDQTNKQIKSYFIRDVAENEYKNEKIGPLNLDIKK